MYSGMHGQGGRLGIKKSAIKNFIGINGNVKYTLWEAETDEMGRPKKLKPNTDILLNKDVDFSLRFRDVLYCRDNEEKGTVDVKYNNMTNYNISKIDFEEYKKENIGFFKSLVWYYEKETRLLIELTGYARKHIKSKKTYVITLDIDDMFLNQISVMFAPGITAENLDNAEKELRKHCSKLDIKRSNYHGTVTMNFCSKCNHGGNKL